MKRLKEKLFGATVSFDKLNNLLLLTQKFLQEQWFLRKMRAAGENFLASHCQYNDDRGKKIGQGKFPGFLEGV